MNTFFLFFSILLILFNVMSYYTSFNKASFRPLMKMSTKTLTWKSILSFWSFL